MESLALTSASRLTGHSSEGRRTESHWPDLGHMPLIPDPIHCYLRGEQGSRRPSLGWAPSHVDCGRRRIAFPN